MTLFCNMHIQQWAIPQRYQGSWHITHLHEGNALLGFLVEHSNSLLEPLLVSLPGFQQLGLFCAVSILDCSRHVHVLHSMYKSFHVTPCCSFIQTATLQCVSPTQSYLTSTSRHEAMLQGRCFKLYFAEADVNISTCCTCCCAMSLRKLVAAWWM